MGWWPICNGENRGGACPSGYRWRGRVFGEPAAQGGGESGRRACWGAGASTLSVGAEQGLPRRGVPWWCSLAGWDWRWGSLVRLAGSVRSLELRWTTRHRRPRWMAGIGVARHRWELTTTFAKMTLGAAVWGQPRSRRKEAHERRGGRWLGEEQQRLLDGVVERRAEWRQRSRGGQQSFTRRRKWIGLHLGDATGHKDGARGGNATRGWQDRRRTAVSVWWRRGSVRSGRWAWSAFDNVVGACAKENWLDGLGQPKPAWPRAGFKWSWAKLMRWARLCTPFSNIFQIAWNA
jgi:hypothetical protein